jgi:hypothetical protein
MRRPCHNKSASRNCAAAAAGSSRLRESAPARARALEAVEIELTQLDAHRVHVAGLCRREPSRSRSAAQLIDVILQLSYGALYGSSTERTAPLDGWLWTYNTRRPHGALRHKPATARFNELDNLTGSCSLDALVRLRAVADEVTGHGGSGRRLAAANDRALRAVLRGVRVYADKTA